MPLFRLHPAAPEAPALTLANTEDVLQLGARLDGVKLIVLDFPKFTDGRAYSQALARARGLFSVVYQPVGDGRITAAELRLKRNAAVPLAAD